uniref:Coiled-coil domain containing 50 n=2 Tax=Phasianus colchicus TaxID=9054 RepID=A0A669Q9Y1_PHACC
MAVFLARCWWLCLCFLLAEAYAQACCLLLRSGARSMDTLFENEMLQFQLVVVHLALVITLLQWHSSLVLLTEAAPEPSADLDVATHPTASEEKSASSLEAKMLLLDELVSLENEVTETKKKRSFPGFGSPIDRISVTSVDAKGKQRKVVELPKRRFGVPLDRIGVSRLGNTKG